MAPPPALASLPPITAVAVTAEMRLAYVLRHFRLVYEDVPAVAIGYADADPAVEIASGADDFFEQGRPFPPPPGYRMWAGQSVPFFFDTEPLAPLLTLLPGRAVVNADIVAAAFYLLSGWQEYFSHDRDRHGRFPYASSVQMKYGFVTLPVVNYYFDVLKAAVEHVAGRPLPLRCWNGAPFAAFISHDIDSLHGGWGTAARSLLRHGRLGGLLKLCADKARARPAPWNNLESVQAETARYGAPSTFFILGNNRPARNATPNADYESGTRTFLARLEQLEAAGAEIASHGSYGSAEDAARLREEITRFKPLHPVGNRFHYLCWEPTRTPATLALAGIAYDSTLGFAEHFGFRHSFCLPFYPFNFATGTGHDFLEIPLNVMDTTLHHPNYLQLGADEIVPALQPMLAEIARFGGVATVLWHNANFAPANRVNGPRQFAQLMHHLQEHGAVFLTGREICQQMISRAHLPTATSPLT